MVRRPRRTLDLMLRSIQTSRSYLSQSVCIENEILYIYWPFIMWIAVVFRECFQIILQEVTNVSPRNYYTIDPLSVLTGRGLGVTKMDTKCQTPSGNVELYNLKLWFIYMYYILKPDTERSSTIFNKKKNIYIILLYISRFACFIV